MRRLSQTPAPLRSRLLPSGSGEESRLRATQDLQFPGEFLGAGNYGEVYLHKDLQHADRSCVVKTVQMKDGWSREDLVSEAEVMESLDHPHVLRLLAWYEFQDCMGLVMDYCEGGELMDAVREGKRTRQMPESWGAAIFAQLFEALAYCHGRGIVHKDLKTENILLLTEPPTNVHLFDFRPHAVLADFGLSESIAGGGLFEQRGHEVAGTGYTMAPEVWKGSCGVKADVWSLGCVLFQFLSNRVPFDPPDSLLESLPRPARANVWLDMHKKGPSWDLVQASQKAKNLCKEMLRLKEKDRPHAYNLRSHEWIEENTGWCKASDADVRAACSAIYDWHRRHPLQKAMCIALAAGSPQISDHVAVFSQVDKDRNGVLSKTEVTDAMVAAGQDATLARNAARSLSFEGDGCISCLEFMAACLPATGAFYDRLLSGEFDRLRSQSKGGLTAPQVASLFERLMRVGEFQLDPPVLPTGDNGLVSLKEFKAFFGPTPIPFKGSIKKRHAKKGEKTKDGARKAKPAAKKPAPAAQKRERMSVEPMEAVVTVTRARQLVEPSQEKGSGSSWGSGGSCSSWGSWNSDSGSTGDQDADEDTASASTVPSTPKTKAGQLPSSPSVAAAAPAAAAARTEEEEVDAWMCGPKVVDERGARDKHAGGAAAGEAGCGEARRSLPRPRGGGDPPRSAQAAGMIVSLGEVPWLMSEEPPPAARRGGGTLRHEAHDQFRPLCERTRPVVISL